MSVIQPQPLDSVNITHQSSWSTSLYDVVNALEYDTAEIKTKLDSMEETNKMIFLDFLSDQEKKFGEKIASLESRINELENAVNQLR